MHVDNCYNMIIHSRDTNKKTRIIFDLSEFTIGLELSHCKIKGIL